LHHVATIEVNVSRETLAPLVGAASAAATGHVAPAKKITVQVVPRPHLELLDPSADRVEIDPQPAGQESQPIYFEVRGAHAGQGEVWVIARQRQMGIARLVLKPRIVERREAARVRRASADAIATEAPPAARPFDQLNIYEQT